MKNKKAVVIIGQTASGKTSLAVDLACHFDGEVVSADSRQVYRHMDVGSGKDLNEYSLEVKVQKSNVKCVNIPYHLIDIAEPTEEYDLARFLADAKSAISEISARGKLPIVAGGTHLWAQALVDGYELPATRPDPVLRARLEALDLEAVRQELVSMNREFYERLHESDQKNKRRLIRYIEVLADGGQAGQSRPWPYDFLVIALDRSQEEIERRIEARLKARLENEDMLGEVSRLNSEHGVPWPRLISLGLEYKYCALHLLGRLDYDEMFEQLARATKQFAKRQRSWIKRWQGQGREIKLVSGPDEARGLVREFLK